MAQKTFDSKKTHKRPKISISPGEIKDLLYLISPASDQAPYYEQQDPRLNLKGQMDELAYLYKEKLWQLYQELYDLAPIGYITLNSKGLILDGNLAVSQLLNEGRKSLRGKPFSLWLDNESLDKYNQMLKSVLETGQRKKTGELKLLKKDGGCLTVSLGFQALHDVKENTTNCLLVIIDISQRIAVERKLEETSTALKVIMKQQEEERIEIEKNIFSNIQRLIMPHLDKLKQGPLQEDQARYLQFVQSNLESLTSPFVKIFLTTCDNLTPREIEIANLVKNGRTTKEIAALLSISRRSVEFHKDNIRKKMHLTNKKINLQSHLMSLSLGSQPR